MKKRFIIFWPHLRNTGLYFVAANDIADSDWEPESSCATEYDTLEEAESDLQQYLSTKDDDHFDFYQIIPVYRKSLDCDVEPEPLADEAATTLP